MWVQSGLICALLLCLRLEANGGNHHHHQQQQQRKHDPSYSYQFIRRDFPPMYPEYEFNTDYDQPSYHDDKVGKWLCAIMGICTVPWFNGVDGQKAPITTVHEWSQLEYDFPSADVRQRLIGSGDFIPGKPTPIDVDVHYADSNENRIFVTIPRFQDGIPATLGTISEKKTQGNPRITPYPSWRWHENPRKCNRDRLVSVYRIMIDECDRLWILDTGRLESGIVCPPQILAFDLKTDQLLYRHEIPRNQYESNSIFVTPVVDVRDPGQCRDTFVYAADCQGNRLVVYDVRRDTSWVVIDKTMYPYPTFGTYDIAGDSFELMDGILGMALEPLTPGEDRKLYFHAMSSNKENYVYTSYLKNQSRYMHDPMSSPEIFHTYRGTRPSQSAAEAIDKNGIAFFGVMHEITIDCWNTATEYDESDFDIISDDQETMQFASGVKVITNKLGNQELWFITNRFQKVADGTINPREINFRISAGKIEDILLGKTCRGGKNHHHHHHPRRPGRY